MAFNPNAGNNNNNAASNNKQDDSWKAQGFLNLYLPSKDGGRRKLGAIPLKDSKVSERDLLKWLNEDPSRVQFIMDQLIIEFNPAVPEEATGFDLPE